MSRTAVLILGGTAEARELASRLAVRPDLRVVTSLAGLVADPAPRAGEVRIGGFGGVDGLAERDAVQGVRAGAGRQRAHDGVGKALHHGIEGVRPLDALGEGRRPGQQGGLAGPARAPGRGEKGLPHV